MWSTKQLIYYQLTRNLNAKKTLFFFLCHIDKEDSKKLYMIVRHFAYGHFAHTWQSSSTSSPGKDGQHLANISRPLKVDGQETSSHHDNTDTTGQVGF